MSFSTTVALATTAALIAAFFQGFSGFGFAIFGISFLSLFMPLRGADQIVYVLASVSCWTLFLRLRRRMEWKRLPYIAVGLVIGVPIGVWLGPLIDEAMGKRLVGLFIMGVSLPRLLNAHRVHEPQDLKPGWPEIVAGTGGGLLSGWVNMSGPPLVYWAHRRLTPDHARAILACAFVMASFIKGVTLTARSLWIGDAILAGAIAAPAAFAGTWLGDRMAKRTRPEAFARRIWILFLSLGALLFLTTFR
ncbi:MAG: sulfite exporter TauE/SafE family protein [Lentisphaerae bacterium]|nr:sulfite exporter TauE/SafE family protein [Lentisphaerota bacterium]